MTTQAEAMKRWCPFVRAAMTIPYGTDMPPAYNRFGMSEPPNLTCLASACMAWRWHVADPANYDDPPGYCGLVGRPVDEE